MADNANGGARPGFSLERALHPDDPLVRAAVEVAVEKREFKPLLDLVTADAAWTSRTREVTGAIRALTKKEVDDENRERVAVAGGVDILAGLLSSHDNDTVENAVTAMLNLSLNDMVKEVVFESKEAIRGIVSVVRTGSPTSKGNAAATLFTLADSPEHRLTIGEADAITPLINLMESGTVRGQKDALLALFNLSLNSVCNKRMIKENIMQPLITLLNSPEPGIEEKVVALLSNLVKSEEGTDAIMEVDGVIGQLVETVESGSLRGKEDAASTLLSLARRSPYAVSELLQDPPDLAFSKLSINGTLRARTKAVALTELLKKARSNVVVASAAKGFSFTHSYSQSFQQVYRDVSDEED